MISMRSRGIPSAPLRERRLNAVGRALLPRRHADVVIIDFRPRTAPLRDAGHVTVEGRGAFVVGARIVHSDGPVVWLLFATLPDFSFGGRVLAVRFDRQLQPIPLARI